MKLGVSHYNHKSILDAKFESGGSFSFGDRTSRNFPQRKGTTHQIHLFTPEKRGLTFKQMSFYVQNGCSRSKIDPHVNFGNFKAEEHFFIL